MTDEERQEACEALRNGNAHYWKQEWYNELADEIERLAESLEAAHGYTDACKAKIKFLSDQIDKMLVAPALAQSDAEPQETWNKQPPGPDSILHELGDCPTQSDAEPVELKTRFEKWAFTRGHRNFTKLGEGYLLPEIQKDWLAFHTQSDAEPVAWRNERAVGMREAVHIMHAANLSSAELRLIDKHCDWQAFKHAFNAVMKARASRVLASVDAIETERAYTAPPRPDASAGLIEAAEIAEALASDYSGRPIRNVTDILSGLAKNLHNRARAADRSEK